MEKKDKRILKGLEMNFGLEKKFVHTRSHSLRRGFFGEFSSVSFLVCFCLFIYFLDDDYIGCRY